MFILLGAAIGLLLGLFTGGSPGRLSQIRLRWPVAVLLALLIKEAGIFSPLARTPVAPWLFAASLAALIGWTLWHRDQLRLIWLVSLGMTMNLIVVLANGAHMPVTPRLAVRAGIDLTKGPVGQYVLATSATHLNGLGDWITLPGFLGRAFPQAYSPGDLVSYVGIFLVLFLATRARPVQTVGQGATVR